MILRVVNLGSLMQDTVRKFAQGKSLENPSRILVSSTGKCSVSQHAASRVLSSRMSRPVESFRWYSVLQFSKVIKRGFPLGRLHISI